MVFRETFETQDVRRMCEHAERHHEMKKLVALFDRLNRQMAEQGKTGAIALPKPPAAVLASAGIARHLDRVSVFER